MAKQSFTRTRGKTWHLTLSVFTSGAPRAWVGGDVVTIAIVDPNTYAALHTWTQSSGVVLVAGGRATLTIPASTTRALAAGSYLVESALVDGGSGDTEPLASANLTVLDSAL